MRHCLYLLLKAIVFKDRTVAQNCVVREIKTQTKPEDKEKVIFENVVMCEQLVHALSESQTESVDKSKSTVDSMA